MPNTNNSSSVSSVCNDDDKTGSNMAAKLAELERKMQKQEKTRKEESDRRAYEAKRLLDQLAQEEQYRLRAQEKYAKKLEQEEKERAKKIRKDREAALKAQQQWEMAAIARETEAMRLEERERRKQAEQERLAEEHRKLKIQREKARAAEIKERNRLISEEKKLREAEYVAKWQREQRERERERNARLPKKMDCISCMETVREKDTVALPCHHTYCGDCIKGKPLSFLSLPDYNLRF